MARSFTTRPEKVNRLKALLGSWREPGKSTAVSVNAPHREDGVCVEALTLNMSDGARVQGLLCRPAEIETPAPAILYIHAHGHRYEMGCRELIEGRPAIADPPYGVALARRGYAALCIDLPTFGSRRQTTESAAAKARLWYGATLLGDMLSDLAEALSYLQDRGDVDETRVGALGLSMGGTLAYWLGALDERIAAVAQLCVFASLRELVLSGAHDLHGNYMTVPGLLADFDSGTIAGLIAPRPHFIGIGEEDPLTPPRAFDRALADVTFAYRQKGSLDALCFRTEADVGHMETSAMREAILAFLDANLAGE